MDDQTASWRLISVLFSTLPLTPALAMTLAEAAFELHHENRTQMDVAGDAMSGRVKNLRQDALLGTIGGPTFEARLELDEGDATVRYILTREAIEEQQEKRQRDKKLRREYLN